MNEEKALAVAKQSMIFIKEMERAGLNENEVIHAFIGSILSFTFSTCIPNGYDVHEAIDKICDKLKEDLDEREVVANKLWNETVSKKKDKAP